MKKFIISLSILLLLFAAFFLMLVLSDTTIEVSLIGSGAATVIAGTYCGLVLLGKPLKAISSNIDNFTTGQRIVYFVGLMIVNLSVCRTLLETNDATIDSLPLPLYGICLAIAIFVGICTRKSFTSLSDN